MKDFMEKWNTDSRFKTKVKLGLYTLFVIFVAIFAIANRGDIPQENLEDDTNISANENNNPNDKVSIEIPKNYNYTINIRRNNNDYQYIGTKTDSTETITKTVLDTTTNYKYEAGNYYKEDNDIYVITTKDEIYDIVNYNYLNLETINQYLSKSIKENNQYLVYLKDIILGNDTEDYITITITNNSISNQSNININYTSLMKIFDNNIENYIVTIKIEEIE